MKTVYLDKLESVLAFENDTTYVIAKGDYSLGVNHTQEKFVYISNNDGGLKNVAFLLENAKNIVLDFSGSTLTFEGRITPFMLLNCENVSLKNVTVQYDRPFFTCGKVLAHGDDYAELFIDKNVFPYRVENGAIIAYGEHWEKSLAEGVNIFIEMDNERKRPAYNTALVLPLVGNQVTRHPTPPLEQSVWRAEELPNGNVVLRGDFRFLTGNNRFVFTHEERWNCDWVAIDSKNLSLENVVMRESGAMGALFQNCENISLNAVVAQAREGEWYLVSTNCDATHYVNCRGKITLENCLFEHMMDDGGNFHGIYTLVQEKRGNTVIARLSHFQQQGVNIYNEGDVIEITSPDMKKRADFAVRASKVLSPTEIELTLAGNMDFVGEGYVIDNKTAFPEIYIKNCKTGANRPRGFLLNSNKKTVVEGCTFYNSDVGIAISGDNSYWFEATGVRDVTIKNCVFDNCGYHCSNYSICIRAEISANPTIADYHSGICVQDNLFKTFSGGCVYVANCKDFRFENNVVEKTSAYPLRELHGVVEP